MADERPMESTAGLLDRAKRGDAEARDRLASRFLPRLRRWAHGRLPPQARGPLDTDDLVQVTLVRALDHVESFEARGEGAFLAYLRRILLNAVRDELRRPAPAAHRAPEDLPDPGPALVEQAMGRQVMERYEEALGALDERQREAVILRIEFGYSHEEVAEALGAPSANAARMIVTRALVRLSELLDGRV
jgi:RNA polymerase sigma-70 factor (ECF subfamily)